MIGYWSLEARGGATFDSCIRFLGEDPWVRLRELKKLVQKNSITNVITWPKPIRLSPLC